MDKWITYRVMSKDGFCVYSSPNKWECEDFIARRQWCDYEMERTVMDVSRFQSLNGCAAHLNAKAA